MTRNLPAHVVHLLRTTIDSFVKLDLVVALHSSPRTAKSVDELGGALELPRDEIREAAVELRKAGIVDMTARGEVQLLLPTSSDGEAIEDLVRLYKEHRFILVQALGEIAIGRLRHLAVRRFADAFLLSKPPRDDDHG